MKSILILSPHPDDAVFSCADHIIKWRKNKYSISVCTVFSKINNTIVSLEAAKFSIIAGFNNIIDFEQTRYQEDKKALSYLDVKYISPKLTDAAFRSFNQIAIYPHFNSLFKGKINKKDKNTTILLKSYLLTLVKSFDYIIVPFAIGRHVDHLITKSCANSVFLQTQILYYFDVPYFFKLKNWSFDLIKQVFSHSLSVIMTSKNKQKLIDLYLSQRILTFGLQKNLWFPEIIMNKFGKTI